MKQAIMKRPGLIEFETVTADPPGPGEVQIRIQQIGICGSDIHVWHGSHPFTSYPIIQGHEFMGVVEAIGAGVEAAPAIGSKVTALPQIVCGRCNPCKKGRFNICENLRVRGFQADGCGRELYNLPSGSLVDLPPRFTRDQGALVEPVAVAVHACSRAGDLNGRNVVVLGAGTIGNLLAQVAKAKGAHAVLVTDLGEQRLDVARQCGADFAVNTGVRSLKEAAQECFGDAGFDIAFEAAGAEAALGSAVAAIEKGGTILIVGVYGKPPVVDMAAVGEHEVVLAGSMMYWHTDWQRAVELLDGVIVVAPLISGRFTLDAWNDAYRYIDANGTDAMKIMIEMPGNETGGQTT